jgi:hypothetical protein
MAGVQSLGSAPKHEPYELMVDIFDAFLHS